MACCCARAFCTEAWKGGADMALIDFLLTQTCTIEPWLRVAEGQDIYGEPETRKCRLQADRQLNHTYVNPSGVLDQDVGYSTKMFCTGEVIPDRSRITCDGRTYIVIRCYQARGLSANHLEVYLQ